MQKLEVTREVFERTVGLARKHGVCSATTWGLQQQCGCAIGYVAIATDPALAASDLITDIAAGSLGVRSVEVWDLVTQNDDFVNANADSKLSSGRVCIKDEQLIIRWISEVLAPNLVVVG